MSQNERDSEQDDGFYNQINEDQPRQDLLYEAPSRRALKKRIIKKRMQMGKFTSMFELILEKETQQKKRNESLSLAGGSAQELIDEMKKCYEKDLRLYRLKKKANAKLRYVQGLERRLLNVANLICRFMLPKGFQIMVVQIVFSVGSESYLMGLIVAQR